MLQLTSDGVYRSRTPMTEDDLRKAAPSIFQTEAHGSRSSRYCYIPTVDIVRGLRDHAGLEVYGATQQKTRDASRRNFAKHVLRLRRPDQFEDDGAPEILLFNAHDGSSSYRLMSGFYRFVCANGIIAGEGYEGARIKHEGDVVRDVIEATYEVVKDFDRITDQRHMLRGVTLNDDEAGAYAEAAFALRYDDAEKAPTTPRALLSTHRGEDRGADLWRTFNRVQENLIRGGQSRVIRSEDEHGRPVYRRKRARAVKGIDQNTALNRALWTLTERMAELKA